MENTIGPSSPPSECASVLERSIKDFVRENQANRHPVIDGTPIFDEPLVAFADGDDPLFTSYKEIIGSFHMTPREALSLVSPTQEEPEPISVVSWVLPIPHKTRMSNRRRELTPSFRWSHTRWYGEQFNDRLRKHVATLLGELGYLAVAPVLTSAFKWSMDEEGQITSTWSERHAAYAAGLGTFSLSDGFITPAGIAIRCGNVVTNLRLPPTERKYASHLSNCLHYRDGSCGACIDRCPAGAITSGGHDKRRCMRYQVKSLEEVTKRYKAEIVGCGLCQTGVPCESRIPKQNSY